jgi:hypothetical protein
MSGANQVNFNFTLEAPNQFNGSTVTVTLTGSFGNRTFSFTPSNGQTSFLTGFIPLSSIIPPGTYTGVTITVSNGITPNTSPVITQFYLLDFRGPPNTSATSKTDINAINSTQSGGTFNIIIACLHGSSLIQMKNETKRLDQIKVGDLVLSGTNLNEYAKVKDIAQCWLSFMGTDHDAIIFEIDSLGENEPTQKLIIDPGHPMCTQEQYLKNGHDSLRPAATFWEELKGDKIYTKKWTDIFVQEEPSVRYDLILEEPHNNYIANGIVVRSKGYRDHRYKQFV